MPDSVADGLVVGGGPAGLTAAICLVDCGPEGSPAARGAALIPRTHNHAGSRKGSRAGNCSGECGGRHGSMHDQPNRSSGSVRAFGCVQSQSSRLRPHGPGVSASSQRGVGWISPLSTQPSALMFIRTWRRPLGRHQRTTIPGLYAAGDVVLGLDQISHATNEAGVAAANPQRPQPPLSSVTQTNRVSCQSFVTNGLGSLAGRSSHFGAPASADRPPGIAGDLPSMKLDTGIPKRGVR